MTNTINRQPVQVTYVGRHQPPIDIYSLFGSFPDIYCPHLGAAAGPCAECDSIAYNAYLDHLRAEADKLDYTPCCEGPCVHEAWAGMEPGNACYWIPNATAPSCEGCGDPGGFWVWTYEGYDGNPDTAFLVCWFACAECAAETHREGQMGDPLAGIIATLVLKGDFPDLSATRASLAAAI